MSFVASNTQNLECTSSNSGSLLEAASIVLREVMECADNRKCFDCVDVDSPRYVCFPFSTFVCSCCAILHKEVFGHPIKCLNVFLFTASDVSLLQEASNKAAARKWLAKWTSADMAEPDPSSPAYQNDARVYLKAKYVEKKWYSDVPAAEKLMDDKATSPMFKASAFLSPPLMCPYMPPAYMPTSYPPPVINYVQYPSPVDAPHFYPRAAPVPVQFMEQHTTHNAPAETEDPVVLSSSSIINIDPSKPYYAHPYSPSPTDFKMPLFPHSLSPREYSPPNVSVSSSPPKAAAFALSPPGPISGLSRSTTVISSRPSSPVHQQSLHRSVSDTLVVGSNSPRKPDLKVSPAHKNIDKSAIRQKFKVYTIMSKMAGLLSPKKQES